MNLTPTATTRPLVPFDVMVNNLFKRGPYANQHSDLVHAAMGILGEAVEVEAGENKGDTENAIEEFGDLEFYLSAALQTLSNHHHKAVSRSGQGRDAELLSLFALPLVELAEQFHDKVKKVWVYGQDIQIHALDLAYLIGQLQGRLEVRYDLFDTTREKVLEANQNKLAKRYPEGVYTDKGAFERADKAQEA